MTELNVKYPDDAYVGIARIDDLGSEFEAATDISSWSESGFTQDISSENYFANAKVTKQEPQEDGEVKFDIALTRGEWERIFWNATGSDFTSGSARQKYRITLLVTDVSTATGSLSKAFPQASYASGSIGGAEAKNVYRVIYANAYATSFEPSMAADEYMKGTITFKVPPTDEEGYGNRRLQVLDNETGQFAALGSYTSTSKW